MHASLHTPAPAPARWTPTPGVGRALALVMRPVPPEHRLAIALRLAGPAAALLRHGSWPWLHRPRYRVNSARDLVLYRILSCLTGRGVPFDLPLAVENEDYLLDAVAAGRGVLLAAPHCVLGCLAIRRLYERGVPLAMVGVGARFPLFGTPIVLPAFEPTPTLLLRARRRMCRGEVVCAMIDRESPAPDESGATVDTDAGPLFVSDALVRTAVSCGAAVVFIHARAEPREVGVTFGRAPDGASPEAIVDAFGAFVRERVRRGGAPA